MVWQVLLSHCRFLQVSLSLLTFLLLLHCLLLWICCQWCELCRICAELCPPGGTTSPRTPTSPKGYPMPYALVHTCMFQKAKLLGLHVLFNFLGFLQSVKIRAFACGFNGSVVSNIQISKTKLAVFSSQKQLGLHAFWILSTFSSKHWRSMWFNGMVALL